MPPPILMDDTFCLYIRYQKFAQNYVSKTGTWDRVKYWGMFGKMLIIDIFISRSVTLNMTALFIINSLCYQEILMILFFLSCLLRCVNTCGLGDCGDDD